MIPDDDFIHGAALTAIADASSFTAINRASDKTGHYVVNHDRHLLIKYATGGGPEFSFTFSQDDKDLLKEYRPQDRIFAVLVCGHECIAALSAQELFGKNILNPHSAAKENVRITAKWDHPLSVRSATGELDPINRSAFPQRILR